MANFDLSLCLFSFSKGFVLATLISKPNFLECRDSNCPADRSSHLSCGSLKHSHTCTHRTQLRNIKEKEAQCTCTSHFSGFYLWKNVKHQHLSSYTDPSKHFTLKQHFPNFTHECTFPKARPKCGKNWHLAHNLWIAKKTPLHSFCSSTGSSK